MAIDRGFGHLGIYHSAEQKQVRQIHLASHNDLRSEQIDSTFHTWVRPAIPKEKSDVIAMFCRLFARRNQGGQIPYGFSHPAGALDETGALTPGIVGLTCASLVLSVFDQSGEPIVDYGTWPIRSDDEDWESRVAGYLGRQGHVQQMEQVEQQIPATRYRPVEVAAAAACEGHPVDFKTAIRAVQVLKQVAERSI